MENLTIIIPIHEYKPEMYGYIQEACDTLHEMEDIDGTEVIIIGDVDGVKLVHGCIDSTDNKLEITDVVEENTEFCNLINKAALLVTTKYFTILEFDDWFDKKWFTVFKEYEKYYSDASVYLPVTTLITDGEKKFAGFVNEIVWSSSFAEVNNYGYIDSECLKYYRDFNVTGGIIKTDDFISVGSLKPSFSIVAWYEFLLRLCFNEKKGFVLPKYGYYHRVGRKGSLMDVKSKELDPDYVGWLIEQAATECNYREERELNYNKDTGK